MSKFKVGQKWKQRNGKLVTVTSIDDDGVYTSGVTAPSGHRFANGTYYNNEKAPYDLVELFEDVAPSTEQQSHLTIPELIREAHRTATEKGWHETERSDLELLMLIVSEVAEACESVRSGESTYWKDGKGKPEGIVAELADVVIRVADFCGARGWDLDAAVREKMEYNRGRSHRHGGKLI